MSPSKIYDISPEEREVKEWRASRRLELRNEYLRELQDPARTEPILDRGLQRFYATRVQLEHLFKPTLFSALFGFGLVGGSAVILSLLIKKSKDDQENLYRTGQVSYRNRMFKFQ